METGVSRSLPILFKKIKPPLKCVFSHCWIGVESMPMVCWKQGWRTVQCFLTPFFMFQEVIIIIIILIFLFLCRNAVGLFFPLNICPTRKMHALNEYHVLSNCYWMSFVLFKKSSSSVYWLLFFGNNATMVQEGAVLDKVLQPHESHIPYLLQFLVSGSAVAFLFFYFYFYLLWVKFPFLVRYFDYLSISYTFIAWEFFQMNEIHYYYLRTLLLLLIF